MAEAVALAMTGEEIEALTARSRSRTEPAGRVSRERCCSAIGRSHRSLPWDEDLACIIRRCSAASSGSHGPSRRSRASQRPRDLANSRRSRRRPRPACNLSACDKAKEHGYPHGTVDGLGFRPAMRASADRRRVTYVSPV